MWDGEFCGYTSLRVQGGTEELPPHVTGHIGYAVAPWKAAGAMPRRRSVCCCRSRAPKGLRASFMVTCYDDNEASRRVIASNGGKLAGRGPNPLVDGKTLLTFWIDTS